MDSSVMGVIMRENNENRIEARLEGETKDGGKRGGRDRRVLSEITREDGR